MTAVHSSLARLLVAVGWKPGRAGNQDAISLLGILSSGLLSIRIASLLSIRIASLFPSSGRTLTETQQGVSCGILQGGVGHTCEHLATAQRGSKTFPKV